MSEPIPAPKDFLDFLHALNRRRQTLIVVIDGRGGSGKSTFSRRLERAGSDVAVVEMDDFYRPERERLARAAIGDSEVGGDFDWRRLRDQVLLPLSRDEPLSALRLGHG
jgi:uridine kinase